MKIELEVTKGEIKHLKECNCYWETCKRIQKLIEKIIKETK